MKGFRYAKKNEEIHAFVISISKPNQNKKEIITTGTMIASCAFAHNFIVFISRREMGKFSCGSFAFNQVDDSNAKNAMRCAYGTVGENNVRTAHTHMHTPLFVSHRLNISADMSHKFSLEIVHDYVDFHFLCTN